MADNQEYQNLINSGENNDLGLAIQNLINDNLRFIRTTYLAKIVSINENKVSIKPILRQKANEQVLIINNCMIAFPYSQLWQTQFKLKVGDIGVAIVIENDISSYKQSGNEGLNNTKRFKDVNDSIFVPLSLYTTLNNSEVNYKIENNNKSCKMEFNNDEIGIFKAKLITLESETTTLKSKLLELVSLLESMASGQTGPDGHGQTSTTSPGSIGQFNSWGSSLNSLFKD
ncbi:baseplate assembly protein [Campylobacter phage DA10]|nr:baseplate assembly protein [Campylobacter phage DA10]